MENLKSAIAALVSQSDHKTVTVWAADCAERVLPYFEEKHPEDTRPRKAIEAGRSWVRVELKMTEARKAAFASHAAARDAEQEAEACAAARAAGHAAATAHVPSHAVHAASYALVALSGVVDSIAKERDWQYQHLLELRSEL